MLLYAEHRTCTAVELCFSNFSFFLSSFFFFCLLFPFSIETLSFLFFFFFCKPLLEFLSQECLLSAFFRLFFSI